MFHIHIRKLFLQIPCRIRCSFSPHTRHNFAYVTRRMLHWHDLKLLSKTKHDTNINKIISYQYYTKNCSESQQKGERPEGLSRNIFFANQGTRTVSSLSFKSDTSMAGGTGTPATGVTPAITPVTFLFSRTRAIRMTKVAISARVTPLVGDM